MDNKTKQFVADKLFANTTINKEQYEAFHGIVKDLGLELVVPEDSWENLAEKL